MFWILLAIIVLLSLLLIGQLLAAGGDAYLTLDDSRPVGGDSEVITIRWWGLATRAGRSTAIVDADGRGFNDMRFYQTRAQVFTTLWSFGLKRPITVTYRMHAGNAPAGNA